MKNYINSQLGLIRFLLTAFGAKRYSSSSKRRRWWRKATRNGKGTTRGRGLDTRRVAAPVAPGQPLPSPRRNPTRRSLPPTPRFLGPSQSPGSTSSSAPFSGPAAPRTPAFPSSSPLLPGAPTPDSLQLAPDSPSPVTWPWRAGLAGQPRLRGAPETLGAASDRVSGAGPHRARAATPPSQAPGTRGSKPLQPLLLLTPPAAPRYLRAASTTDPAAGRRRGGGAGARKGRRRRAGRADCTPTPPGGGCGGPGPQEFAPSGSEWQGRGQASPLTSPHSPVPGPGCPVQCPRRAPTPRRARASLFLLRRAPRLSFYILFPTPIPSRRDARARPTSHSSG